MTNMKRLKKNKQKPALGDIFSFQILDDKYHWGRVVSLTASVGGFDNCILIYIYKVQTETNDEVPELITSDILLAPIATNELPWKKGYFNNFENKTLSSDDLLQVHCFYDVLFKKYFDDKGRQLESVYEPHGIYGLDSYRTIDDKVSEAIGLELAPD
ncbi:Imm26 family immunity protein [Pseudoalteromonas ruthenica]|uniref:Imm26 family immunity protein n=2 Tax=Pseudoalteromonas ruthenica TaxID=151081 RepID=UPI00110B86C8|nr:Imm26 family immunity protein [Pseudoalteromonas ruthenica]TMO83854.1 hypothetical protein CWC12_19370 [Pseudoalteromonas ruthenica]TMP20837.1 hypothetical protein CWC06_19605 [Pseudoalteromonas ruthenica]